MKQLKYSDLTPEMMKDLEKLETASAVADYFAGRGFSISEKDAEKLIDQIRKVSELTVEDLKNVAGGWGSKPYTQISRPPCPVCGCLTYEWNDGDFSWVCTGCGHVVTDEEFQGW